MSEYAERAIARINDHFSVEITFGEGGFTVEWFPEMPAKNSLSKSEIARYKEARNKLISSWVLRTGKNVAVVDL